MDLNLQALLDEALYAPDPVDRDRARAQLTRGVGPRELPLLLALLDARTKLTRRRAARLISDLDPALSHPALTEALADPDRPPRLRVAAARILTATSDALNPALAVGLTAAEPAVRRACATPAAPRPALTAALTDPDQDTAHRAAQALEATGALPPLAALTAAVERHGATGPLARLLARAAPDAPALAAAARAGDPTALDHLCHPPTLRALLTGPSATAAAWALARGPHRPASLAPADRADPAPAPAADPADPAHLADLCALAAHPEPAIRAAAARHLPPDHPTLPLLTTDPDPGVAWLAERTRADTFRDLPARLGPHARSAAPSARAPYGLRPGDPLPAIARAPAALALCQTSFDVNLGVAVRSAEAAGLREVLLVSQRALFASPAQGTDHVIPVTPLADPAALIRYAREAGYQLVAVQQTPRSQPYHTAPYPPRPLFMMGAEGEGLPDALRLAADLIVEIPLFGAIDSLNVAAAATTVIFHWRLHHGP